MKKRLIIPLFILSLTVLFILNQQLFKEETKIVEENIIPIKGLVWVGEQVQDPNELTLIGANAVEIIVWAQILENNSIVIISDSTAGPEPWAMQKLSQDNSNVEQTIRQRIKKAKDSGLQVYLVIYPERLNKPHRGPYVGEYSDTILLKQMRDHALTWAKIAEEERVDFFSPANELFLFVGLNKTFQWYYNLLPDLRKVYSGNILPRGFQAYRMNFNTRLYEESEDTQFNLSGFDYVSFDIYANHVSNFSDVREYTILTINKAIELKEKYKTKGIIFGEIGFPHAGDEGFWKENLSLEEVKTTSWEIFLNESTGKVDGLFFWDWKPGIVGRANPEQPNLDIWEEVGDNPINVVKKYYLSSQK